MGYGMTLVLGEMDMARVHPYRSDQVSRSAHGLVRTTAASGGHPVPGAGTRSVTYPLDDVHRAWITYGVGDAG